MKSDELRALAEAALPGPVEGCECYCHGTHPTSDICPHCSTNVAHTKLHRAMTAEQTIVLLDRLDMLEAGLMVNMRIRQDEVDLWARRLIAADARTLRPWLAEADGHLGWHDD